MSTPQYTFRAQKAFGISDAPTWQVSSQVPVETAGVRCYTYSSDGEWVAYATASGIHLLPSSSSSTTPAKTLSAPAAVALHFSPLSTWLFSFERPVKSDTDVHKNLRAWDVQSGEEVGSWYQKNLDDWQPIITSDESYLIRPTSSDLLIFSPPLAPRPSRRLHSEGSIKGIFLSNPTSLPEGTSSAKPLKAHSEPAVAVWTGEKNGAPASVALYPLSSLLGSKGIKAVNGDGDGDDKVETAGMPMTTARKAFYKADKLNVKWNAAGTMALFLTHTDVDQTGKSYYGETNLYLVGLDGSFDGLVDLDKEGPIYDFVWSPTSRDFTVCYGYMPARVQMFDSKTQPVHSFGSQHRNFLMYQPQGRLLLSAGFGNLAGGVDVWDVSTRNKVAEFKAANSSHCEWSPCGRYILTATLSPRLRVDNGIKIWWCGGQLLHIHPQDELYQVSFRPEKLAQVQPFPPVLPPAPEINESVTLFRPKGETSSGPDNKPAGAYRPPGARGTIASEAYKRGEEGGSSSGTSTPTNTPMFRGGKPAERYVSVRGPPGSAPVEKDKEDKKKRVRSKRPMKEVNGNGDGARMPVEEMEKLGVNGNGDVGGKGEGGEGGGQGVGGAEDEAVQKKIRNLMKKLKAIDDLKDRLAKGEALEQTQVQKIATEEGVKKEIEGLGRTI